MGTETGHTLRREERRPAIALVQMIGADWRSPRSASPETAMGRSVIVDDLGVIVGADDLNRSAGAHAAEASVFP